MKQASAPKPAPAGSQIRALGAKVVNFQGFDTFPTPIGTTRVRCVSDEVTSNCPVTGQPDWYVVEIDYVPAKLCLESKTIKLYLQSFRDAGNFCETFATIIARDVWNALQAESVMVTVHQKPRGGVAIHSSALWTKCTQEEWDKAAKKLSKAENQSPRRSL